MSRNQHTVIALLIAIIAIRVIASGRLQAAWNALIKSNPGQKPGPGAESKTAPVAPDVVPGQPTPGYPYTGTGGGQPNKVPVFSP